jgi:hypothetical protein
MFSDFIKEFPDTKVMISYPTKEHTYKYGHINEAIGVLKPLEEENEWRNKCGVLSYEEENVGSDGFLCLTKFQPNIQVYEAVKKHYENLHFCLCGTPVLKKNLRPLVIAPQFLSNKYPDWDFEQDPLWDRLVYHWRKYA